MRKSIGEIYANQEGEFCMWIQHHFKPMFSLEFWLQISGVLARGGGHAPSWQFLGDAKMQRGR